MILCVVDDLMFSVKISTAARQVGVDIYFERSPDKVLPGIRDRKPSLVILDLNSATLKPLDVIAAVKSDPDLRDTRLLGYVAHVQGETIAAARRAGADEVLARSAFSERLGEILSGADIRG